MRSTQVDNLQRQILDLNVALVGILLEIRHHKLFRYLK